MPLTVNKRTWNLVSGHQRLSVMDELEKGTNYRLTVAVVDLDDEQERRLNVFLNNTSAMGDFDDELLVDLIKDLDCDTSGLGFDKVELDAMLNMPELNSVFSEEKETDTSSGVTGKLAEIRREIRAASKEKNANESDFYAVAVFQTAKELDAFLVAYGTPVEQRYIDGRALAARLGIDLPKAEPAGRKKAAGEIPAASIEGVAVKR